MAHPSTPALKRLAALFIAGWSALAASGQAGPSSWLENLHLSAEASVATVDNLSRTSHEPTRKDGTTWNLALASTQARQLAPSVLLVATASAESLVVPDFALNNQFRLGGRLALQRKFGLGPQATVLQLRAGATWKDARLDDDDGWTSEAGVELAKRLLPNLRVAASATWREHTARRDTFDLSQRQWSVEARWDIDEHWSLSGSVGRLEGDIVANAAWPIWGTMLAGGFGPVVYDYYTSRPWKTTDLFGPGWVSYNVEANVDLWSLTLGYAVSDRTSLELGRSAAFVVNAVGITYPTDSWTLGLSHRF